MCWRRLRSKQTAKNSINRNGQIECSAFALAFVHSDCTLSSATAWSGVSQSLSQSQSLSPSLSPSPSVSQSLSQSLALFFLLLLLSNKMLVELLTVRSQLLSLPCPLPPSPFHSHSRSYSHSCSLSLTIALSFAQLLSLSFSAHSRNFSCCCCSCSHLTGRRWGRVTTIGDRVRYCTHTHTRTHIAFCLFVCRYETRRSATKQCVTHTPCSKYTNATS